MDRSTEVESPSRILAASKAGLTTITAVHWSRSCARFRSRDLSRAVCEHMARSESPPAQIWPERPRSHFEPLGTRSRPLLRTSEPSAQPHRSKWHHGSPAESGMLTSCRLLQPSTQNSTKHNSGHFATLRTFEKHHQAVPASHRALPGDLGGGRGGRPSAPTPWTAPTSGSRIRKGVNEPYISVSSLVQSESVTHDPTTIYVYVLRLTV